jgi:mediator of RNA polymerase II transcription subunit 17
LGQLIPRITQERGSFANITEEILNQEIESGKTANDAHDAEMEDVEGEDESVESWSMKQKDFDHARQDLIQLVRQAYNESALSLDFVSLLLSCLRPAAGTTSMSPHLKQHVAVGSLGADLLATGSVDEDLSVLAGWKIQALDKASKLLKESSERLKSEVTKEARYWESVLETTNSGEVIFKIRKGDARGLGIKYGFGDAGSEYRDKGVAVVSRKTDGNMSFSTKKPISNKVIIVTLYDTSSGEKVKIGSSTQTTLLPPFNTQNEIKNARNLLFEEELFFEMIKEARLLLSQKVTIRDKIVINLIDEIIEIEYVSPFEETEEFKVPSRKADLICAAFHILVCYAHRRNLEKQRTKPAPLRPKPKQSTATPSLFILRPLVAHMQHHKVVQRTTRLLEMIVENHKNAKLELEPSSQSDSQTAYLGKLLYPPLSKYTLTVENGLIATIVTSSPLQSYSPLYDVTAKLSNDPSKIVSKSGFYELSELEDWVSWIMKKHVADNPLVD